MRGAGTLVTGRIATLAGLDGPGWVEAIAVEGGRVVAAGRLAEVESALAPGARRLRLAPDEVAIPGLTDAHLHLAEAALARRRVNLEDARSIGDVIERVRAAAAAPTRRRPPGSRGPAGTRTWWVAGRPPRTSSVAAPGRLVALWAHDHHALLASAARPGGRRHRRRPSRSRRWRDPARRARSCRPGSSTRRPCASSRPSCRRPPPRTSRHALEPAGPGARRPRRRRRARPGRPERAAGPRRPHRRLPGRWPPPGAWACGCTPCIRAEQLDIAGAEGLRSGQPLGPDPLGSPPDGLAQDLRGRIARLANRGAAASRSSAFPASLRRPTTATACGSSRPRSCEPRRTRAAALGITTQIHGIGDAAVRAALDALAPTAGRTALMPRVEHTQLVHPETSRGSQRSASPPRCSRSTSARTPEKARRLWGARAEAWAYAFAALDRAGRGDRVRDRRARGAGGPVARPRLCRDAVVARLAGRACAPFGPQNALDLWRAVRASCVDAAVTAGETDRGRLVAGHRADVVVIPAAAVDEPVEVGGALWHARPRLVLVDGEVVVGRVGKRRSVRRGRRDVHGGHRRSGRQGTPRWRRAS